MSWLAGEVTAARMQQVARSALVLAFVVSRGVVLSQGSVFRSFDSTSYDVFSFTGSAPRPWGVPLLYAVASSSQARLVVQWAVATIAWSVLGWVLWQIGRHLWVKVAAMAAAFALGLASTVTSWDFALLSESLSISLAVLATAFLIRWTATKSIWALIAFTAAAFWMTFTRLDMAAMAVAFAATVIVCGRKASPASLLASIIVLAGVGWSLAIAPATDREFHRYSATGLSQSEETFLYRLRLEVYPEPETLSWYRTKAAMPDCPGAQRVADGQSWAIEEFSYAYLDCPELRAWALRHKSVAGYQFAFGAPRLYLEQLARSAPEALSGSGYGTHYATEIHMLPTLLEKALYQPRSVVLAVLFGGWFVALLAVGLTRAFRGRGETILAAAVIGLASAASTVVTLMHSAGEYSRLGMQEAVLLRLSILVLAVAAADAILAGLAAKRLLVGIPLPQPRGRTGAASQKISV